MSFNGLATNWAYRCKHKDGPHSVRPKTEQNQPKKLQQPRTDFAQPSAIQRFSLPCKSVKCLDNLGQGKSNARFSRWSHSVEVRRPPSFSGQVKHAISCCHGNAAFIVTCRMQDFAAGLIFKYHFPGCHIATVESPIHGSNVDPVANHDGRGRQITIENLVCCHLLT